MTRRGLLFFVTLAAAQAAGPVRVLIIDGQNNHKWRETTPALVEILGRSTRFTTTVATTPPEKADMSSFVPDFSKCDVVLLNYNGDDWPATTREAFLKFVRNGGGVVVYHAANNAFAQWPEFNEIIGLGGWGGRTEKSGPWVRWRDGKMVKEQQPGRSGSHGKRHNYAIDTRAPEHPIMKGLPAKWMHVEDELYDRLRGPANIDVMLATAFSAPETGGTGENEPLLFTLKFGKGRIFHTGLGHDRVAMECVGFQTTLLRGLEWAATGKVTQKVPKDFPTATELKKAPFR
jgi:type 1 glutamine amidotransferase